MQFKYRCVEHDIQSQHKKKSMKNVAEVATGKATIKGYLTELLDVFLSALH